MPTFTAVDFVIPGKTQAQIQAALNGIDQAAILADMTSKVVVQEAGLREKIKGVSIQKHPIRKFREKISKHRTKAGKVAKILVNGTLVELSTTTKDGTPLKTDNDLLTLKAQVILKKAKVAVGALLMTALGVTSMMPPMPTA